MIFTEKNIYTSNSVNSLSKCVSWGSWLACGMTHSVVLIKQNAKSSKIFQQFTQHQAIVTCLSWISESLLISADELSNVILWEINPLTGDLIKFSSYRIEGLSSAINDIHGIQVNEAVYFICSSESIMQFLKVSDGKFQEIGTKECNPFYILCVNLFHLKNVVLIFYGIDDGNVLCNVFYIGNDIDASLNDKFLSKSLVLCGHEDWITSLNSIKYGMDGYLASSSQDSFIRIWKISLKEEEEKNHLDIHKLDLIGMNSKLCISLDGVLAGHENWVTSTRFRIREDELILMTTSMDKSIILWSQCSEDEKSQWMEEIRLGEIGGNGLGLIGGDMNEESSLIVGFGYQGNMMIWSWNDELEKWETVINSSGHFDIVEDLSWESEKGRYLITVSKDQTTRLHAPWRKNENDIDYEWHEIGRPQIHGFDMTCVASIDPVSFITGSDEKISRVFGMNKEFGHYFKMINPSIDFDENNLRDEVVSADALGLSNKTVDTSSGDHQDYNSINPIPKEDSVSVKTLWPEVTKLYGHVYEVFRISCHKIRKIIATTCKALSAEYADIILWDGHSWTILDRLSFHKSTIVRVQFNKRGDKIVSVSKDRQWALWKDQNFSDSTVASTPHFQRIGQSVKSNSHSKIIWDVDWTQDDKCFATVSRDKKMILWNANNCQMFGKPLLFSDSVNAISTMPISLEGFYLFAVGLENGDIRMVQFDQVSTEWSILLNFNAHHDWITRLMFHPQSDASNKYLLASCAKDRFVKIFEILISE